MRTAKIVAIAVLAVTASPLAAAEYLTSVASEVYQTTGSPKEIATRASTCISQNLAQGSGEAPLIISSDLDGGVIVARNSIEYGSLPRWKIRSRLTFEAREGRFRIEQTTLERFNTNSLTGVEAWGPIGKWAGSGWKKAEEKFAASATAVAQCVISGPKRSDW
jgi:hypothetical protein